MPLPASDFDRLFAPGTQHVLPSGHIVTVRLRQGTSLWLPSGRVVAGELTGQAKDGDEFVQRVAPGRYPVALVVARSVARNCLPSRELVAAAKLVIRNEPIGYWEMAVCGEEDVSDLDDNEFYGYPVEGTTGGFVDATKVGTLQLGAADHGTAKSDHATPVTVTDEEGMPVAVLFSSGHGRGEYPTWIGRTALGEVACFLTDFLVLAEEEPPPFGRAHSLEARPTSL